MAIVIVLIVLLAILFIIAIYLTVRKAKREKRAAQLVERNHKMLDEMESQNWQRETHLPNENRNNFVQEQPTQEQEAHKLFTSYQKQFQEKEEITLESLDKKINSLTTLVRKLISENKKATRK